MHAFAVSIRTKPVTQESVAHGFLDFTRHWRRKPSSPCFRGYTKWRRFTYSSFCIWCSLSYGASWHNGDALYWALDRTSAAGIFNDAAYNSQFVPFIIGWFVNYELQMMWKEVIMVQFNALFWHGLTEENRKQHQPVFSPKYDPTSSIYQIGLLTSWKRISVRL
jgi:hypothetical protein